MTTVELFTDIGLDMTMTRTMEFASKSAQDSWFSSKVSKKITDVAFNKLQNVLKLPMDYGTALSYTYVRFTGLDSSNRKYYYFVASIELIDDSTIAMHLAVDPIQTFMAEWSIGPCMVNRKHCDRWDSSTLPIRDNSNIEGIMATYVPKSTQFIQQYIGTERIGSVVFSYTKDNQFMIGVIPIVMETEFTYISLKLSWSSATYNLPTPDQCFNNSFFRLFNIDPESVINMSVLPFVPFNFSYTTGILEYTIKTLPFYNNVGPGIVIQDTESTTKYAFVTLEQTASFKTSFTISRPTKPSSGVKYSSEYEPALFKEPYILRKIVSIDGMFNQDVPDYIVNQENSFLALKAQLSPSQQVVFCSINEDFDSVNDIALNKEMGLTTTIIPSSMDVMSNAWLTYCLTQRDSDRAIINNNNMQNAISNLLFMGYGGALVGSRGGGIIKANPVYDNVPGVPRSQQTVLDYRKGLNPAIPGAVGLAAGASIVTSLVDAHFAWENQKQEERKIQNKASQITVSGNTAYMNHRDRYSNPIFVETVCDDVNFEKAANNFRYYGYEINEWQTPNIKSRKYYDYIMTNGAIIEGSIPQDMKEQIAKVLDSGITFFHADYSSTPTYNDYENIERALL